MNATIEIIKTNSFPKPDYKDKSTGEMVQGDYVVQGNQIKTLSNGSTQIENFDIPVDRSMEKVYAEKKVGEPVKVLCNVYGENFAQIKIGKAK